MKLILCTVLILISLSINIYSVVRYVSKSGSSTYPYTTWASASDSIQKAINISDNGDTIVVANGVYKEVLNLNRSVTLLGLSIDSTIIDSRGLTGLVQTGSTVYVDAPNCSMRNFHLYGIAYDISTVIVWAMDFGIQIENCFLENAGTGIGGRNECKIKNLWIKSCCTFNIFVISFSLEIRHTIENCINIVDGDGVNFQMGYPTIKNNIFIVPKSKRTDQTGIYLETPIVGGVISNNLFIGFNGPAMLLQGVTDTLDVYNNVVFGGSGDYWYSVFSADKVRFRNNILAFNREALNSKASSPVDYNLYWGNKVNRIYKNVPPAYLVPLSQNEMIADPMFVNGTDASQYPFTSDFHLQKYSPCIDKGDPSILDKDGSRSDIGLYGGPDGESYSYNDLAPRAPVGLLLRAVDSVTVRLKWRRNTEKDTSKYLIYTSPIPGVKDDSTYLLTETRDTLFTYTFSKGRKVYFRIKAVDVEGNASKMSEEIGIDITSVDNPISTPEEYTLYPNYPNPFNPSTVISYRLKNDGKVKLTIYDIKGEIVKTLLNREEDKGYHEVIFSAQGLSSGIYLYRIEVTGKGNIPAYSDMKKMVLVK